MPAGPASSGSSGGGGTQRQQQGQTGGNSVRTRPLVEVISVEADFTVIGTIAVFDGKRGQIIYKSSSQGVRSYGDELALTGPYKAISADGSFAIQVYGISSGTDTSDESSNVIGEMFWDCDANNYNEVLTCDIISTDDTGGRLAEVTYAVWSEAVEATMEVNPLLPDITYVYGTIFAYNKMFGINSGPVLFDRERYEKVELVPSSADSMVPLELRRSVIALPMLDIFSGMSIFVRLRAATPNNERGVILSGAVYFFPIKHTGEFRIYQSGDFFVPVGWTWGSDPTGSASHQGTDQPASSDLRSK